MQRTSFRLLAPILLSLLMFGVAQEEITLDVWIYDTFAGENAPLVQAAQNFMEENPDITINLIPTQYGSSSYRDKFIVAAQAGAGPDALMTDVAWSPSFAAIGLALPIDEYASEIIDEYYPGPVETVTYNRMLYGLPFYTNVLALFYNETAFEEAGLPLPEEGWTWDDFMNAVDTLSNGEMYGFGLQGGWGGTFEWYPWVWQNSGKLLVNNNTEANFTSPEVLEATRVYLDLVTNPEYVPEAAKTWKGWSELAAAFSNGVIATFESGDWSIDIIEEMNPDFEWGVAHLPMRQEQASVVGGANWMINTNTDHPDAAYRWIEYVTGPTVFEIMDGYNRLAARRGAAAEQEIVKNDPRMQVFVESLEYAEARPTIPLWTSIDYDCLQPAFLRVILEGAEVEASMAEAQQCAANILSQ